MTLIVLWECVHTRTNATVTVILVKREDNCHSLSVPICSIIKYCMSYKTVSGESYMEFQIFMEVWGISR